MFRNKYLLVRYMIKTSWLSLGKKNDFVSFRSKTTCFGLVIKLLGWVKANKINNY